MIHIRIHADNIYIHYLHYSLNMARGTRKVYPSERNYQTRVRLFCNRVEFLICSLFVWVLLIDFFLSSCLLESQSSILVVRFPIQSLVISQYFNSLHSDISHFSWFSRTAHSFSLKSIQIFSLKCLTVYIKIFSLFQPYK